MNAFYNPFKEAAGGDPAETELITRSLQGDRRALEALILRHQSWIYNIALRMVYDPAAAEDDVTGAVRQIEASYGEFLSLFRSQPFLKAPDMVRWLRDLLDHEDIKPIFRIA